MTDTVQQLHELPDLAAECFATWGHPNPSERPVVAALPHLAAASVRRLTKEGWTT